MDDNEKSSHDSTLRDLCLRKKLFRLCHGGGGGD